MYYASTPRSGLRPSALNDRTQSRIWPTVVAAVLGCVGIMGLFAYNASVADQALPDSGVKPFERSDVMTLLVDGEASTKTFYTKYGPITVPEDTTSEELDGYIAEMMPTDEKILQQLELLNTKLDAVVLAQAVPTPVPTPKVLYEALPVGPDTDEPVVLDIVKKGDSQ